MATKGVDMDETSMTAYQLAGHMRGLLARVQDGSFNQSHFCALAEGRNPFAPAKSYAVDVTDRIEWWRAHYNGLYGINPDFSGIRIPDRVAGFDRLVIVPKGLTHRKWVETALKIHGVYLYTEDLDGSVTVNDRTPNERSYAVWIRDRQEADEELKGESANTLDKRVAGVTLLERLVAGTGHLFEKMHHMDTDGNVTLCIGSRYSDGGVPSVDWRSVYHEVYVGRYSPSYSRPGLRARALVS